MAQAAEIPSNDRIAVYLRRCVREFQQKQQKEGGRYVNDLQVADAIGVHRSPFCRFMAGETNGSDKIVPGLLRLLKVTSIDDFHEKVRDAVPREPQPEPLRRIEHDPRLYRLYIAMEHARLSGIDLEAIREVQREGQASDLDLPPEQWRKRILAAERARNTGKRRG